MKEVLLCKYGEIVLKGANKRYFEDMLCRELRRRAANYGDFDIYRAQSTIYIEPKDEFCDMDGMFESASKSFGIVAIGRAAVCEKNMESITATAREYIPQFLQGGFPLRSLQPQVLRQASPWAAAGWFPSSYLPSSY